MREIKFRGKRIDGKGWAYGFYSGMIAINGDRVHEIHDVDGDAIHIVDEKTVGQFTGLQDKEGVDIYEGDVIHRQEHTFWSVEYDRNEPKFIVFNQLNSNRDIEIDVLTNLNENPFFTTDGKAKIELEVIGNIHEEEA